MARITVDTLKREFRGLQPGSLGRNRIAEFTAVNYTPYLGGDYEGYTLEFLEGDRVVISGYPSSKSILGKARWLARILVGSVTCAETHKDAENKLPLGSKNIPLIPFMFGFTNALNIAVSKPNAWRSPFTLIVKLESNLFDAFNNIIDSDIYNPRRDKREKRFDRYNTLLSRARGKDRRLLAPVKPYSIKLRIEIVSDKARLKRELKNQKLIELVEDFYTALIVSTLTLLGVGKAANRGFGRFKINDLTSIANGKSNELREYLQALNNCLSGKCGERDFAGMLSKFLKLTESIVQNIESISNTSCPFHDAKMSRIIPNTKWIKIIIFSKKSNSRNYSNTTPWIDAAIEAIAYGVAKFGWKIAVLGRNPKAPGSGLDPHTWPLGLPRDQKYPDKECKLRTGYLVLKRDDNVFYARAPSDLRKCTDLTSDYGRRQSMLIAFPLPPIDSSNAYSGRIVLWILPGGDFLDFLRGFKGCYLYHAGPHSNERKYCVEPVIRVDHAAKSSNKIEGKPAGVTHPSGYSRPMDLTLPENYEKLLGEIVLEFVEKAVRRA